jgi:hypothetical protein
MRHRNLVRTFASLALLPLCMSCGGASFDVPSEIKGLRVLAVQKTPPYPNPGESVDLKVLYWDGKSPEGDPRPIDLQLFACFNPKGDLYYNCGLGNVVGTGDADGGTGDADGATPDGGADASAVAPAPLPHVASRVSSVTSHEAPINFSMSALRADTKISAPGAGLSSGGAFADPKHVFERSFTIPEKDKIIVARAPGVPPYGLAYSLFTACAGHVGPAKTTATNSLPIGCFDANETQLGPDDFILGYASMYIYEPGSGLGGADRVNNNPEIDDFLFDQGSVKGSTEADDDATLRHFPRCTGDRAKCAKYAVKVKMDPSRVVDLDDDPTATTPSGARLKEQVWVSYYTTGGELKSGLRLVNDAQRGWNEDNATELTLPDRAGPLRIFAVVHDNRGGVTWAEGKIIVD